MSKSANERDEISQGFVDVTSMRRDHGPRCLFVQFTADVGGSPVSGLTVVDVLKARGMDVVSVFGVSGPLEHEYRARGCSVYHLTHGQWLRGGRRFRKLWRWVHEIRATWQFTWLIRRVRPRLVYVNTLMSIAAVVAARASGVPVIWHIRELLEDVGGEMHFPLGGRPVLRTLVRGLPTKIVCVSQSVQKNVLGAEPYSKARVIYNPLVEGAYCQQWSSQAARALLGLPSQACIVGLPGTLRPVKGHEFFIDVAAELLKDDDTYHFVISGAFDHRYASLIRKRCSDLGIGGNVHFLGAVGDMRAFYAACSIVCVPSRAEPFGRTIIEAFAQRRPVVATRTGGIPELVISGETGLLVEYGDVPALMAAIRRFRNDAELSERVIAAAWKVASERFHEDVCRQQLVEVLDAVAII